MADRARRASSLFGDEGWFRTRRLDLLDFDVEIHSDDPELIDLIEELYEPLLGEGDAAHALMLGRTGPPDRPTFFVALDGGVVVRTPARGVAFAHLVFEANQQAIERSTDLVRFHAAGAVVDGRAVVLPGPMGAGKSTLVAGLIMRGHGYLTDEVVGIDPSTGRVRPYARPVSLGVAPETLHPIGWEPSPIARSFLTASGIVPARALGTPATDPVPLGIVVLPTYEPDAPTSVVALTPAEALVAVAAHTFHLESPGTLVTLAGLLTDVPCFRLLSGNLTEAVDAVLDLTGAVSTR